MRRLRSPEVWDAPHLRSNHVLGFPRSGLILLSNCLLKAILEHHMRGNEVGEQVFSLGDFGPSAFSFSTNRCWRPTIRMLLARMSLACATTMPTF